MRFLGGRHPVTDGWRTMPYTESGTIGGTAPHQFHLLPDLPDAVIAAHATGGTFLNWLHDSSRVHTAYTAAEHGRLRELKLAYEPSNLFGLAKNIPPAVRVAARLGA